MNKQPALVNCGREMLHLRERKSWTVKGLMVFTLCFLIEQKLTPSAGRLNAGEALQVPFIAPRNLHPLTYPSNLSNENFPSKNPSVGYMERTYDTLVPQPYAPIFDDITITPCYDLVQESYAFSSTLQNATFLTDSHGDQSALPTSEARMG